MVRSFTTSYTQKFLLLKQKLVTSHNSIKFKLLQMMPQLFVLLINNFFYTVCSAFKIAL